MMYRFSLLNRACTLLLSVAFLFWTLPIVNAIEFSGTGGRSAFPRKDNPRTESIFIHTLNPGDTVEEGIHVLNNTEDLKTLLVYAVDSAPATSGGFACNQLSDINDFVGTWMKLKQTEVTLQPKTNKLVPFKITVPKNVEIGEHDGCIVIESKNVISRDEKIGINIDTRTALRVAVTVPGEIKRSLKILELKPIKRPDSGVNIFAKIQNTGNVSIDTNINIDVKNIFGKTLQNYGGEFHILHQDTMEWNFAFPQTLFGGIYSISLNAEYNEDSSGELGMANESPKTKLQAKDVRFFIMPSMAGLTIEILILVFILFIILMIILASRRRRWIKKTWVKYKVKKSDNIRELAEYRNVSWKLLAKANKLRAPYTFTKDRIIIIPPAIKKSKEPNRNTRKKS